MNPIPADRVSCVENHGPSNLPKQLRVGQNDDCKTKDGLLHARVGGDPGGKLGSPSSLSGSNLSRVKNIVCSSSSM